MDTDSDEWTLSQRRMDGSVNFYYDVHGFGNISWEYWLRLNNLCCLLNENVSTILHVDMKDNDIKCALDYTLPFTRFGFKTDYTLHVYVDFSGTTGESRWFNYLKI